MKGLRTALLIAAVAVVFLLTSATLWSQQDGTTMPSAAGTEVTITPNVTSRTVIIGGRQVGEVLVDDNVVLRIRQGAGGFTAPQRAAVVSTRLSMLVNQGYAWQDVTVGRMNNHTVLLLGDNLLITADPMEARLQGMTPLGLAQSWRGNLVAALQPQPIVIGGSPTTVPTTGPTTGPTPVVAGTAEAWPDWTNPQTKIVPIVSLGTPGLRLGFAQVTGPSARIDQVQSVIQVDAVFQRAARVFVFVPSSSLVGLNRVQGTAVTALLQYQLLRL